jgi:uncharacterized protein
VPSKPVKVAVIADTHAKKLADLPTGLLEILAKADAIIHLGDYTSPELLNDLKKFGNFYGIVGNHDGLMKSSGLKKMEVIEIGGKRLGLIHGTYLPLARLKRMKAWFKNHKIDMLLFGHSHLVTRKTLDGILLFNPGTVTGQFPATHASFGLLTLDGSIMSEIISLDDTTSIRENWLLRFMAIIIRTGIRWLEGWPYIDLSSWFSEIRTFSRRPSHK